MIDAELPPELAAFAESGTITSEDVLTMRREVFKDGVVSAAEAENLFHLNQKCVAKDTAWNDFFVEALTDYVVKQAEPEGYVTIENADWLIEHISRDGKVETASELELLVNVLDKSRWSPVRLVGFALEQVKQAVVDGNGPIGNGQNLKAGMVGEAEVDLLRRILYAFGGDATIAISREEAEILFDINDATKDSKNHPSWSDLFVKAIANHVLAGSGYQVPSRQEALRRGEWLDSRESVMDILSSMMSGGLKGILDAYRKPENEDVELMRLEKQRLDILTGEKITTDEALWLKDRIGRDGAELDDNETALIKFLKEESPDIDPAFKTLLDKVA